jgi:type IV pilus biogenesis protein CpaD/CtpE
MAAGVSSRYVTPFACQYASHMAAGVSNLYVTPFACQYASHTAAGVSNRYVTPFACQYASHMAAGVSNCVLLLRSPVNVSYVAASRHLFAAQYCRCADHFA